MVCSGTLRRGRGLPGARARPRAGLAIARSRRGALVWPAAAWGPSAPLRPLRASSRRQGLGLEQGVVGALGLTRKLTGRASAASGPSIATPESHAPAAAHGRRRQR